MSEVLMPGRKIRVETTVFPVLFAISFCHLLNDLLQSLLPAIYPMLQTGFDLSFTKIGLLTLTYQMTASVLQPVVGFYADRRPMPFSLSAGMMFSLAGLVFLGTASSYPMLLMAAALLGTGSSVFHPESSRVARMASGGRFGLAQSIFQVGGNLGSSLGPLVAAFFVLTHGRSSISWFALAALLGVTVLFRIGFWYRGQSRAQRKRPAETRRTLPRSVVTRSLVVLLVLIFSKYFYLASIGSYFTLYLIQRFHVSVQSAQLHLFLFLGAVALGTFMGGPLGDRFGRKYVIWFSILGVLPFTLALPYADLFWTGVSSVIIGVILASAFSAIVVYGQELVPGKVGTMAGLFFGFAFGMGGIGAAVLGAVADQTSLSFVYKICAFLPALGILAWLLPDIEMPRRRTVRPVP